MANLIPLEEAAQMLGISVEKLTEMREKSEIFGYRDGANWKFKQQELERVAGDMGISLGSGGASAVEDDDLDFSLSDEDLALEDSSEIGSDEIGSESIDLADDSVDLILEDDSEESFAIGDSSKELSLDDSEQESELRFGESDLAHAMDSDLKLAEESGSNLLDDEVGKKGASDTGKLGEELGLAEDDLFEDELELSDSFDDSVELGSDLEDSDLVLDDSDSSSEVVMAGNDSGINLSPNDSGISLEEEPLELGGSDIDSLELPEDDEMITLEEAADPDMATQLAADDDFNLTPLEDAIEDESSGSQVIALEDSEIYADDSSGAVLQDSEIVEQPVMLPADEPDFQPQVAMGDGMMAPAIPEAPYSIWQVLSLGMVAILCLLGLVIAVDVVRLMWQPEGTQLSSTVLDFFSDALNMKGSQ